MTIETTTNPPQDALLRIESLVFGYGRRRIFEGFQARAAPGLTWLQGANGSGKSTLLRLLAGVVAPSHGSFSLAGQRIDAANGGRARLKMAPLAWRQQTFWCPSDPPPTPWLTIREALGFIAGLYPGDEAGRDAALAAEVRAFGLEVALDTPLRDASLGQQHKASLALALALPVRLLLLDEPLNALDTASTRHLLASLSERSRARRQVILLTSHVRPAIEVDDLWILEPDDQGIVRTRT